MAVVIDAWAVVARRSAVDEKLPGGAAAWCEATPNRVACVDRGLCCAGFMHEADALEFAAALERHGLRAQEGGQFCDVAIAHARGRMRHACNWLDVGTYGGVTAAWLRGSDPEPLVVPLHWRGESRPIFHMTEEEAARRLKFVRVDGNIEVYMDVETGREVYRGRTKPAAPPDAAAEARFEKAAEMVRPFLSSTGIPPELGFFDRRRLRKGIRALEAEAEHDNDGSWRVWWFLGMARRSNRDPEGAYEAFKRAYDVNPTIDAVGREYAGQCMALGKGKEAVAVSLRNCELHPDEAALRSNLALAHLIAGDVERARNDVRRAQALEPDDEITQALARVIEDVRAGKRERPTRFPF